MYLNQLSLICQWVIFVCCNAGNGLPIRASFNEPLTNSWHHDRYIIFWFKVSEFPKTLIVTKVNVNIGSSDCPVVQEPAFAPPF